MSKTSLFLVLAALTGAVGQCLGGVNVERLRCEYLNDPQGIDVVKPRLSWIVQSDQRVERQIAYQVLVASSPELLANDQGDLWNSGRVDSDQTIQVEYAGNPLTSRMSCCWKVRAWDKAGQASAWSKPATWTMGLLKPEDWNAKWITTGNASKASPVTPHNGYHSDFAKSADVTKWVAVDLGKSRKIDAVELDPARPYDYPDTPGFLFPVRFKIEVAEKADFSDAKTVVDQTAADVPNPGTKGPIYRFEPTEARYVRLTVTRLARRDANNFAFALAEMQVLSRKENVAKGSSVSALDAIEVGGWSKDRLVDSRLLPENPAQDSNEKLTAMFRKEFAVPSSIKRAVVSVTGLGLYELRINGQRVGDHVLAPEWTLYRKRIQYQTYDVTDLLHEGSNAVGAMLGGGWWCGPLAVRAPMKDPCLCLLVRLDVELTDGSTQTIVTDASWLATSDSPIRRSGIYFGEEYDATKEKPGWDQPGYSAAGWSPAKTVTRLEDAPNPTLVAQCNEPIRVVKELLPVKMSEPKPGMYVFDMGQNMVGWCRLKADAPAGTKITMHFGEMLNDDGTVYRGNLGGAQTNEYTWRGGEATLEPHFTYHGFRYVELTGLPSPPAKDAIVGRVFHSSGADAGRFECSNELLNKIMHCVEWVQRGNMMGVPTDCPQRTERLGWMGDIQAFSQTAIFTRDMAGFFTKWVPDIRDSQADDGRYPDFAPHMADPNTKGGSGVPAWGDAGTVVPWRMYQNYADKRMLEQHFESARRWVEYIHRNNPNLLWQKGRNNDYNDWLNGDTVVLKDYPRKGSTVPNEVFGTAFFAHSTEIVAKMAHVLDRREDAARYDKLFEDIKAAFNRAYVDADGRIKGDTQAGYALALHFNLLDEPMRPKATEHMIEAIRRYKNHPSTGIQATHRMMLELTRNGHHEEAWRLINLRTCPSLGFMVEMGATTIWECWDGYVKGRHEGDRGPFNGSSYNHWAFGAVGEWVWRDLAGINSDDAQPAFKHFTIRPRPCEGLTWVKARYDSIRGPIVSEWKQSDGRFELLVEVPANTTATVVVPAKDPTAVTESGKPAAEAAGVKPLKPEPGAAIFEVQSGRYRFEAK
jgi:alpha-L-rhamnosidase